MWKINIALKKLHSFLEIYGGQYVKNEWFFKKLPIVRFSYPDPINLDRHLAIDPHDWRLDQRPRFRCKWSVQWCHSPNPIPECTGKKSQKSVDNSKDPLQARGPTGLKWAAPWTRHVVWSAIPSLSTPILRINQSPKTISTLHVASLRWGGGPPTWPHSDRQVDTRKGAGLLSSWASTGRPAIAGSSAVILVI